MAWIVGGNTLARIGVVLLFIGVGFLLKYAVEHVQVPISLRLADIALGGVALLVIGWRLRVGRRAYAMVLQGGGVGVLYLTVFASLRLYELVSPLAAFGLLVSISTLSSWLAVRQDAISLAALAVAGGFLAPILTSSQSGNHVMLFSYYALLNAGILGIAWFKAWRVLNLLGFAFTFLVGTFWGVTRYRPENFATTEPFLILFFLFYVAIAVLYALRRSVEVRDYVDAGLVFGTPLVAAGLQSALVRDIEYGMAFSALAMSALYLILGRFLYTRRRDDIRLLVESFLALGVVFATLAVPLGLDARWTSATWAIEGAAIVWAGVRSIAASCAPSAVAELGAGVAFIPIVVLAADALRRRFHLRTAHLSERCSCRLRVCSPHGCSSAIVIVCPQVRQALLPPLSRGGCCGGSTRAGVKSTAGFPTTFAFLCWSHFSPGPRCCSCRWRASCAGPSRACRLCCWCLR